MQGSHGEVDNPKRENMKMRGKKRYLFQRALVGADALNERHGKRIELVRLMGLVDDGERNAEVENFQVAHFLGQRDDLWKKVDTESERVTSTANSRALRIDGENTARNAQVTLLYFTSPIFKNFLRVQFQAEAVTICLQLLTLDVILPAFACNKKTDY